MAIIIIIITTAASATAIFGTAYISVKEPAVITSILYALSFTSASLYSALELVKVRSMLKLTSSSLMTPTHPHPYL